MISVNMKKILLIGVLGTILFYITYSLFVFKKTGNYIPTNNPSWVYDLINKEEGGSVANPPASLSKCIYQNQNVYYLPPRCCDIPGIVYNDKGDIFCSPGGGITGRGDGKCVDFFDTRKNCVIIWQDTRSK